MGWMMFSNRVGMQSEKFRPLGNGVNDYGLLGLFSLVRKGLQSRIAKQGTIFKLEL